MGVGIGMREYAGDLTGVSYILFCETCIRIDFGSVLSHNQPITYLQLVADQCKRMGIRK